MPHLEESPTDGGGLNPHGHPPAALGAQTPRGLAFELFSGVWADRKQVPEIPAPVLGSPNGDYPGAAVGAPLRTLGSSRGCERSTLLRAALRA